MALALHVLLFIIFAAMVSNQLKNKCKSATLAILFLVVLFGSSCNSLRVTKFVPHNKHLLKRNKIELNSGDLSKEDVSAVIRQQPNLKSGGIKWRLLAFNLIDSTKTEKGRLRLLEKIHKKNLKRRQKEYRINEKRRQKAIRNGKSTYIYKSLKLKDTLDIRLTARERFKYKYGEAPVVADTFLMSKSVTQLEAFLHSKGYFYGNVGARFDTVKKKVFHRGEPKKKVIAKYNIETGKRYFIDTVIIESTNDLITNNYLYYIKKTEDNAGYNTLFHASLKDHKTISVPFDANKLDGYRSEIARFMRDRCVYGFTETSINYRVDTTQSDMTMKLFIKFSDRSVPNGVNSNDITTVKYVETRVKQVFFHICDTTDVEGDFSQRVAALGIKLKEKNFLVTLDTMEFNYLLHKVENYPESEKLGDQVYFKSEVYKTLFGKPKDSIGINQLRIATFLYNDELFVNPELIEAQNYLEHTNIYKEYYLERSYTRLVQLGLFSVIKPEIIETYPGSGKIEVHYYLVPAKKQSFSFEPRANNSNGYLGATASLNYSNKNIFKSGTNFISSFTFGLESNPSVFSKTDNGEVVKTQNRSFNTLELGPSVKLDIPGLFPFGVNVLGKRQRPRTVLSGALNYQQRTDFTRNVFQFNYLYKFYVGKTQIFSFGLPGMSVIKFVSLRKQPEFEKRINSLNDLFLKNAYSDQFIWEDFKLTFEYDNLERDNKRRRIRTTFNGNFNLAGNVLNVITSKNTKYDTLNHRLFLGVPYSQFALLDTKFVTYFTLSTHKILAFKLLTGGGLPGRNSLTSLPYDYSFFGGGSNDNRGWQARSLGPGSYQSYLDSNRVATQIGDIRLASSLEFRFGSGGLFNHAFFVDAGNIWLKNNDVNRPGGQFTKEFYKEFAISGGYGLRLDFKYFIFRLDFALRLRNPALPEGERWIYQSHPTFYQKAEQVYGSNYRDFIPSSLFPLQLQFGIGYPF